MGYRRFLWVTMGFTGVQLGLTKLKRIQNFDLFLAANAFSFFFVFFFVVVEVGNGGRVGDLSLLHGRWLFLNSGRRKKKSAQRPQIKRESERSRCFGSSFFFCLFVFFLFCARRFFYFFLKNIFGGKMFPISYFALEDESATSVKTQ